MGSRHNLGVGERIINNDPALPYSLKKEKLSDINDAWVIEVFVLYWVEVVLWLFDGSIGALTSNKTAAHGRSQDTDSNCELSEISSIGVCADVESNIKIIARL